MKPSDWIGVADKLPPANAERYGHDLLLWSPSELEGDYQRAFVGRFDGKVFWTHYDYEFEITVTHWQSLVAP